MKKDLYLENRAKLMDDAKQLLDAGKLDEFEAKKGEVEALDNKFDAEAAAEANLSALEGGVRVNPSAKTLTAERSREEIIDSTEYKRAFLKAMMKKELSADERGAFDIVNATQTAGTHTALIPTTMMKDIWEEMGQLHPVIADSEPSRTYVRGKVSIPYADITGDGAWTAETTATSEGALTSGAVTLDGYDLSKAVTVSWKLYEMSLENFEAFLRRKLSEKVANALAAAFFTGSGSTNSQPEGVIPALEGETNTPQVVTYTAANGIGYQNIITAMSKITAGYFNGSSIYATSATIWTLLAGIVDNVKQPIFIPDVTASGVGRMFGLPVKAEDGVTAGKVVIGNFAKGYASNMNADVEIHYEEHVLARKTDYAAWTLADGKPMTTKAFAELKPST